MSIWKKIVFLVIGTFILGAACALTIKAAVGVGAWEALAITASEMTLIDVGTCEMIFNLLCVVIQILVLRSTFKPIQLLQIPLNIILGIIINLVLYDFLAGMNIDTYWVNVLLLVTGYALCAFVIAAFMVLDIVTFSLEGACMAIANKSRIEFHNMRQMTDVFLIVLCIVLGYLFDLPWTIREGTLVGMIFFGPLLGVSMKFWKSIFLRYQWI